jgi:glycosyltransferase involved in cell wall biosynthesis
MFHCKSNSPKRIFWLGMHKLLVATELPRLRGLGYEVYNPPYLSPIQDQSACQEWDASQLSTLPKDVFIRLSRFNFFYNDIPKNIAEILNDYFDSVIVTISPHWLHSIMSVYNGKVIYRTYGQHELLSEKLAEKDLLLTIANRSDFTFVPHAEEALYGEHSWLKDEAVIAPYCLSSDILTHGNTWRNNECRSNEIIVTCPNINNAFFEQHYHFLKQNYSEEHYKYYGVQLSDVDDSQVIGTLGREDQISRFQRAAGYLYTYSDPRVCYLPPIEMMVLGGPVLFLRGSLLDRYFDVEAPGRCHDIADSKRKVEKLLNNDQAFIDAVVASQDRVKKRYMPDFVWPRFDAVIARALDSHKDPSLWLTTEPALSAGTLNRLYLLHHFPGEPVVFDGLNYSAYDGIPRVMRQIVQVLNKYSDLEIVITARAEQVEKIGGYFKGVEANKNRIKVFCIDHVSASNDGGEQKKQKHIKILIKRVAKKFIPYKFWPQAVRLKLTLMNYIHKARTYRTSSVHEEAEAIKNSYIDKINADDNCHLVMVPHYYCFPEAENLTKDIALYLPDYMPHFFHKTGEFLGDEGANTEIGKRLAAKAKFVFCNSQFTRDYLPESRLQVDSDKIQVFYLPMLSGEVIDASNDEALPEGLESYKYIFYPTQPRPNKNLSLLLRVFECLIERGHDLKLVLTCALNPDPKAFQVYESMKHKDRVVFLERISDERLRLLYKNTALLCFTSLAEGNFPPQIQEALAYQTPVVAGDLRFITERIPDALRTTLTLCQPNDEVDFVEACERVLKDRQGVLRNQKKLYGEINHGAEMDFRENVVKLFG